MSWYIPTASNRHKAEQICARHGAMAVPAPKSFAEVPAQKRLVCVVCGLFDVAVILDTEAEFRAALGDRNDKRAKIWLLLDAAAADRLRVPQEKSGAAS